MTLTTQTTESLFHQESEQITEIRDNLSKYVQTETIQKLDNFIGKSLSENRHKKYIEKLTEIINKKDQILSQIKNSQSSDEELTRLTQNYYRLINARDLFMELKSAIELTDVQRDYRELVLKISESTPFTNNFERVYSVHDQAFQLYQNGVNEVTLDFIQTLEKHDQNLQNYFRFMKNVMEKEKENRKNAMFGKVSVSLLAGPIMGMLVGLSINSMSMQDVSREGHRLIDLLNKGWYQLDVEKASLMVKLEERLRLILYTLYGGLLLKLAKVADSYGLTVKSIDFSKRILDFEIKHSQRNRTESWAVKTFEQVSVQLNKGDFKKADLASKRFYEFINKNQAFQELTISIANNRITIYELAYTLRYLVIVQSIEKHYWTQNFYKEAAKVYENLLISNDNRITLRVGLLLNNTPMPHQLLFRIIAFKNALNIEQSNFTVDNTTFNEYIRFAEKAFKAFQEQNIIDFPDNLDFQQFVELYKEVLRSLNRTEDDFYHFLQMQDSQTKNQSPKFKLSFVDKLSIKLGGGKKLLVSAIEKDDPELLRTLLELKVPIQDVEMESDPVLLHILKKGKEKSLKVLMEAKIDLDCQDDDGITPLIFAIKKKDSVLLTNLLSHGASINKLNKKGYSALHYAVDCEDTRLLEILLSYDADVNISDSDGETPLFEAIRENKVEAVRILLDAGAIVNFENSHGAFPLFMAVTNGQYSIVDLLIKKKADVNKTNRVLQGFTPLMYSVNAGDFEIAKRLLIGGANPNQKDIKGGTAFISIVASGQSKQYIKLLVEFGGNINIQDNSGFTALYLAVTAGNERQVKDFLELGANPNIMDEDGNTALDEARSCNRDSIYKILLANGAYEL